MRSFPRCKIAKTDDKLVVINLDEHARRQAAKAAEETK